jgi:hypothetical protein
MALEDFLEPEVAATAVVVAAVFSPRARKIIRRGAVYGLAGILVAGDALASAGKSVGRGVQAASDASHKAQAATTSSTTTPPQPTTFTTDTTHTTHSGDTSKRTSTRNSTKSPQEDVGGQAE